MHVRLKFVALVAAALLGAIAPAAAQKSADNLRISMRGAKHGYALSEVEVRDLAFGASANAYFSELAKSAPKLASARLW